MQQSEFDHLMDGKSARFAEMFDNMPNNAALSGLLAKAKQIDAPIEDVELARNGIKKNEIEIPGPLRFKIDIFIQQEREKGTKERQIRRMVQKKFNIQVV